MGEQVTVVRCGGCEEVLDESSNIAEDERTPCPHCGSKARRVGKEHTDPMTTTEYIEAKGKPGRKKPGKKKRSDYYKYKEYVAPHRDTGRMAKMRRGINRDTDRYFEAVIDVEPGELILERNEPLSKHQGHGSAKRKSDT